MPSTRPGSATERFRAGSDPSGLLPGFGFERAPDRGIGRFRGADEAMMALVFNDSGRAAGTAESPGAFGM